MFVKRFKDPIYGYIEIDSHIVSKIIDTSTFQRLKDIRQTSYTPLFPAAYHNRYVHSLGVYHLGRIAFGAVKPQLIDKSSSTEIQDKIDGIQNIFELACLLHDVGHAPFSHTGEPFFLDEKGTLYENLKTCVGDEQFTLDFDSLGTKKPAPHECMSCIVGLKAFPEYFKNGMERSLFARSIIGMKISRGTDSVQKKGTELINCVISLLNSSIIDVDRLDYIIRDAETIGFKSVQVDYMRLLNGMRIVKLNKVLCIGYHKSALSVIESAIYAHDAEKKWIQSHPSILYEIEILKNAMRTLTSLFASESDSNPLFSYEALTEEGKSLWLSTPLFSSEAENLLEAGNLWTKEATELLVKGHLFSGGIKLEANKFTVKREYSVSLLADEDFLFLMKQFCKEGLGYEYFTRNRRNAAVWKSEAEFRALFQERIGDDTKSIKIFEDDFESLVDFCQSKLGNPIVTNEIFKFLAQEERDSNIAKQNKEIDEDSFEDIMLGIEAKRHWSGVLKAIADSLNLEFEFLIIFQKKFSSSFKSDIGDIPILFPNIKDSVVRLNKVIDVIKTGSNKKSNFFHLFYKPIGEVDDTRKKAIVNYISESLINKINYR